MNLHLKKGKWILAFCILSSAIFLTLLIWRPNSIEERVEVLTLDYRFHMRNLISQPKNSGEVVIIAIDERSLKEFGRWPWSRTLMATLVKGIMDLEPKILAVDIFFTEPESKEADKSLGDIFASKKEKIILALPFEVWVGKKTRI